MCIRDRHGTFGRLTYQGSIVDDSLVLTGHSPDGDDGFPGNMDITVTYKLTDDNALVMDYTATTDETTICLLYTSGLAVVHHGLDGVGGLGAGKFLLLGLLAFQHRNVQFLSLIHI